MYHAVQILAPVVYGAVRNMASVSGPRQDSIDGVGVPPTESVPRLDAPLFEFAANGAKRKPLPVQFQRESEQRAVKRAGEPRMLDPAVLPASNMNARWKLRRWKPLHLQAPFPVQSVRLEPLRRLTFTA